MIVYSIGDLLCSLDCWLRQYPYAAPIICSVVSFLIGRIYSHKAYYREFTLDITSMLSVVKMRQHFATLEKIQQAEKDFNDYYIVQDWIKSDEYTKYLRKTFDDYLESIGKKEVINTLGISFGNLLNEYLQYDPANLESTLPAKWYDELGQHKDAFFQALYAVVDFLKNVKDTQPNKLMLDDNAIGILIVYLQESYKAKN